MKKFKVSLMAVLAIVIGIAASSFTTQKPAPSTMNWYEYVGTDPANADHYQLLTSEPICEELPIEVCAVQTNEGASGKPDQDELDAIKSASSDFEQQANNLKYRE